MKNNKLRILNYNLFLFYLFILTILLFSGYSYSKYKSEQIEVISGNIAKPIFIVQRENPKEISINSNFDSYEYHFSIMNYDSNKCSDVALAYKIVVDVGNNLISYKVFDDANNEVPFNNDKSKTFILDNHIQSKHSYKLIISKLDGQVKAGDIKINIEGNQIING